MPKTVNSNKTFRWIDRAGAVLWASAAFRNARDIEGEPIPLDGACGEAIGYGEPTMVGRFCSSPSLNDRKWAKFKADVERDISRVDEIRRFIGKKINP